jgi:hypothetical protein
MGNASSITHHIENFDVLFFWGNELVGLVCGAWRWRIAVENDRKKQGKRALFVLTP